MFSRYSVKKPYTVIVGIILVIVLLIVGPTQIPKLAKLFGKAGKKLKEGMSDEDDGDKTKEA